MGRPQTAAKAAPRLDQGMERALWAAGMVLIAAAAVHVDRALTAYEQ